MSVNEDKLPKWCRWQADPQGNDLPEPKAKRRKCLLCGTGFDSYYGNRLCEGCQSCDARRLGIRRAEDFHAGF